MATTLKVGQQSLLGYLPAIVIQKILEGEIDSTKNLPAYHKIYTVSLFADISGFTKLSESFSKKGRIGPEFLAFSLNRYMEQLINIIGKNGGDIFKFAGDAILVVWPPNNDIAESCQRAIQCALDIQGKLNNQEISPNKRLSVKIGIGVGECTILVVGGVFGRCEYLSVGDALAEACESETKASAGGETICSENVYKYVKNKFEFVEVVGGDDHGHGHSDNVMKFYKILRLTGERVQIKADAFLMRTKFSLDRLREKLNVLKAFVPNAIVKYLDIEKEVWSKEIRMISSMFLNLKVDLKQTKSDEGIQRIQRIVKTVQRCVYRTKGSLNKFLMDDKGSVMVICWGLPPMSNPDDHVRSVLCGMTLIQELKKLNCGAFMGIASGTCFTGVCGTIGGRREYSLLGEIVNLSARHMQKAIYYAKDLEKQNGIKTEFLQLIDEKTKYLIQNKIFTKYVCKDFLKGFQNEFDFYEPIHDDRDSYDFTYNLFPEIKTHKFNFPMFNLPPHVKKEPKLWLQRSLYMIGRNREFEICKNILNRVYKLNESEMFLIRGVTGSGKSLFVRKLLYEFLDSNKDLKSKSLQYSLEFPYIFVSYQQPTTYLSPFNGWKTIFKQIYNSYYNQYIIKHKIHLEKLEVKFGSETFEIEVDLIGKILFKIRGFNCLRYIEEILEIDFFKHIHIPEGIKNKFFEAFPVKELPEIDPFFCFRKFNNNESLIKEFFAKLIKNYKKFLDNNRNEYLEYQYPLIFVLEDCQHIDEISGEFITYLTRKIDNSICIICTYQDQLSNLIPKDTDYFNQFIDIFEDKVFYMENITDIAENQELIKTYLDGRLNIDKIDSELIEIILPKSFKGVPLFTLEMVDSLIESNKYVQHPGQELLTTSELLDMHNDRDWSNFVIPMKIEKIVGHLVDELDFKDIILLKIAATIGNIFDLDKLYKLNPFNFFTIDDMYSIMQRYENIGILEFLHDTHNAKKLVCKFAIPFFRDLLYQRMLIEQRNDIHMNVARLMQFAKFSYMPPQVEVDLLKYHLKKTEKSIINYMEEEENEHEQVISNKDIKFSTVNNQKIVFVKEVCQKLKAIDMKFDEDDKNTSFGIIIQGILSKKSDSNITWEKRHIIMTNKKFFYYYTEKDYRDNKEPLGYFEIKNLYNLEMLPDYSIGSKKNIFSITVSQWMKKDLYQKGRTFYLSTETKDKLTEWITLINFLRVKSTYDEFSNVYGLINLPLSHENSGKRNKKIKSKLNSDLLNTPYPVKGSSSLYNSLARRSIMNYSLKAENDGKLTQIQKKNRRGSFLPKNSSDRILEDIDNQNKIKKSKENLIVSFSLSFICILGFVQDIIFNMEQVGMREEKTISITKCLKDVLLNNINKDSLVSYQDSTSKFNPILTLNSSEKKKKSDEKDSSNSLTSSGNIHNNKLSYNKPKKSLNVDTIKEEDDVKSLRSKASIEEIRNSTSNNVRIVNKNEKVNQSIGKTNTFEYFKKETPKNENNKDIFINLEYKVKRDVNNENSANQNSGDQNNHMFSNKEKLHAFYDSFNVNPKEQLNFEGISNIFPNHRNDIKNNEEMLIKARPNLEENSKVKMEENKVHIQDLPNIINLGHINLEKLPNEKLYSSIDENSQINLRGKNIVKEEEKAKNNLYTKSNTSSTNNLLIVNNAPLTENAENNRSNDISGEYENNQEKKFLKASSHSQFPTIELRKNEIVVGNVLTEKLKYFDLSNNEDFNELFKDDTGVSPENGNEIQKKKKKKNIYADDVKYRDLKTTENFNFYSSNIFSKLGKNKK